MGFKEFPRPLLLYYGGKTMRAKAVTADERYRLIMECRVSGMTDYQWCIAHNIKPGTWSRGKRATSCRTLL